MWSTSVKFNRITLFAGAPIPTIVIFSFFNLVNKPLNFLQYEFQGFGVEGDHLRKARYGQGNDHMDEVVKLRAEGLTLKEIGAKFGLSFQQVDRLIKKAAR